MWYNYRYYGKGVGEMKTVEIFTDGACSGNPGPGGYGVVLRFGKIEKELSGGEPSTTNNRMELLGVITGLSALKEPCKVILTTDSKYAGHPENERCDRLAVEQRDINAMK